MAIVTSWRALTWSEGARTPSPVGCRWSDLPVCKNTHPSHFYGNFPYVCICWQLRFVLFKDYEPNQTNVQPGYDLLASNVCPLPTHPPGSPCGRLPPFLGVSSNDRGAQACVSPSGLPAAVQTPVTTYRTCPCEWPDLKIKQPMPALHPPVLKAPQIPSLPHAPCLCVAHTLSLVPRFTSIVPLPQTHAPSSPSGSFFTPANITLGNAQHFFSAAF